jgi:hypothetical protein
MGRRIMAHKNSFLGIILIGMVVLSACNPATPPATLTPTPLPTDTTTPVPTATATPQPTPTPDQFSAKALAFVPHTVNEISQSVEIHSPIADPEGYKEQFNDKIKPITDKILANYTGETIKDGRMSHTAIDPERGGIMFGEGSVLNPIASAYFEWEGHKVPILYFPAEDSQGRFLIGMVLSPVREYSSGWKDGKLTHDFTYNDILGMFPMNIGRDSVFEARYSNAGGVSKVATDSDSFFAAYFSGNEDPNYQTVLWNYFLKENGTFDRNYESKLLVILVARE